MTLEPMTLKSLGPPWMPIEQAPHDGKLLILAIDPEGREHDLDDSADYTQTVGFNERDAGGEDAWKFAGWCWNHDHFVEGVGTPRYFQHIPELRPVEQQPE